MLRNMEKQDRETFLAMVREFYHTDAVLHEVDPENFERTFEAILEGNPFVRGYLFEYENEPAGYALLSLTYSNEVGSNVVLVEEAFILPQFQGKGLGTELFQFIEREFQGYAKRYRLEVTKTNRRAIALYKRMGYEELDYLQMVKDVTC